MSYSRKSAFQCVKDAVVFDTALQYLDASCSLTVQVDASQVGFGATLLQDNKPVVFASKAQTKAEHCYANTECEKLAVIFGAAWFRAYVYGTPFTTESDHKTPESINQKSLADTPAQLWYMLLCL